MALVDATNAPLRIEADYHWRTRVIIPVEDVPDCRIADLVRALVARQGNPSSAAEQADDSAAGKVERNRPSKCGAFGQLLRLDRK